MHAGANLHQPRLETRSEHPDRARRPARCRFTAHTPNQLRLTDIPEHRTGEGKLYLCAVKDAGTNRILGYSMAERMTSQLTVDTLTNAIALNASPPEPWSTR
jgi:transposase InsO family protein